MYWRNKALVLPGRLSADSQIGQKQYASVLSWLSVTSQSPYYIDISAMHCDFIMHLLTVWQWVACHWPISTMHMSPVHWQQRPSMRRGTAEAGPCNYYNSYRFPRIIIVTLQLTFCSITWPTHLPSVSQLLRVPTRTHDDHMMYRCQNLYQYESRIAIYYRINNCCSSTQIPSFLLS